MDAKTASSQEAIFLQRRGVSHTLMADAGLIHFEFSAWQGSVLHVGEATQYLPAQDGRLDTHRGIWNSACPSPLETLLREVETRFGFRFDSRIEAYCYEPRSAWEIWPHIKSDIFRTCAVYEKGTDTVRHATTNVCLVAFPWPDALHVVDPDGAIYTVDPAAKPYEAICRRAVAEYNKSHNQRNSPEENKAWLAWLIGEWIKDELKESPELLTGMIR